MKGFPSSLKLFAGYQSVSDKFEYFKLDESSYNAIFYNKLINESGNRAKFIGLNVVLPKKLVIEPMLFPNYKLVLNPKLEKGYNSIHPVRVNIREESISADFETDYVEWAFPVNTLISKKGQPVSALVNVERLEFHNDGNQNEFHRILLKGIKGFELEASVIPDSFIELTDCKNAEFKLLTEEAYQYPNLVFESMPLCRFMGKYTQVLKKAGDYKSSILLKQVLGKIKLQKDIECEISELYFFENNIAGVLTFPLKEKETILASFDYIKRNSNRQSPFKLKSDGSLPGFSDIYQNTYLRFVEEFNSIKMYFFIVK
jgi:hypothetical protein